MKIAALIIGTGLVIASCAGPVPSVHHVTWPRVTPSGSPYPILILSDPGHVTGQIPSGCVARGQLQDRRCTPGGVDPVVSAATIDRTICIKGYTATVRPPQSETGPVKRSMYPAYGIPVGTVSELDHLIPLELGGDNDTANLWPEVGKIPNPKDLVENALRAAVCSHKITLDLAQTAIAADWTTARSRLGV